MISPLNWTGAMGELLADDDAELMQEMAGGEAREAEE